MSGMNLLEKLLDGVTVEWKALREVAKIQRGKRLVKSELEEFGNYAVFQNCMTPLGYYHESNVKSDTTFIISAGAAGEIGYSGVDFWAADDVYYFLAPENLKSKFLYYFLLTQQTKILGQVRRASVPRLSKTAFEKIQIPIPPLETQAEIVRILDTFTELTAELTAELGDRQKQYNYYRDRLLTFEEGEVEWKPLGEIGEFTYGYSAKAQDSGDARFVRITDVNINGKLIATDSKYVDISGENERYLLRKGDLLMARTGATYGKTMIFEEDYPAIYAGFLIKLSFDERIIIPKFYWHFAQSNFFWNQANRLVSGGGQPQFNANVLKDVKILIPSLEEQACIVAILDKFDALTNSISEGLPREITLRQKQYEYYRDLLLTFPKAEEQR
jgi:type I restriction enzyme, S subunit